MNFLRRLRGLVVTSAVWSVGWLLGGLLVGGVVFWIQIGPPFFVPLVFLRLASPFLKTLAMAGAVTGAGFATLLLVAERRRTLSRLTAWRAAFWGAVGGVAVPVGTVLWFGLMRGEFVMLPGFLKFLGTVGLVSGTAGALMAGTHVGLARRGLRAAPAGEDVKALSRPET